MNDKMDYKQIARELFSEAKKGIAESQCLLGQMYGEGLGVKQDYKQAAVWLKKAADYGHAEALYHLGRLYQNGQGVERDHAQAVAYFQKAAKLGNVEAQAILTALQAASSPGEAASSPASVKPQTTTALIPSPKKTGKFSHFSLKKIGLAAAVLSLTFFVAIGVWFFWPSGTMTMSGVVSKVMPATVFISVEKEKGGATGSGFFAMDGMIFTNAHVVEKAKKITIKTHEGKSYNAEVLDENKDLDLAVLTAKVNRDDYSNLTFTSEIPAPGSEVVVIGSPLGYEQTISNGLVSAVRHYDNDLTLLQISAPISPGSSGSPVVNMRGQVVGVATMTSTKGQNLNFAVSHTSVNRSFSRRDTHLVQSGVPTITEDGKTGLLRVNGSKPVGVSKSPEGDRVKVLDTEQLEVRLLAKVRSEKNGS